MDSNVELIGLGVGSIRLRRSLVTNENVCFLFGLKRDEKIVFTNSDGDELDISNDSWGNVLHVLTEDDLKEDCPFTMDPSQVTEQMRIETAKKLRNRMIRMQEARVEFIRKHYTPKRPEVYTLQDSFLEKEFISHFEKGVEECARFLQQETSTGLYSFPFFTEQFCDMMIEEIEHFEASGLPISRPNSMNNYGVVLDEIGFGPFFVALRETYISPLSRILYPREGNDLNDHHGFVVKYKIGEDTKLDFHYDSSEVTLNVCLGKTFTGGSLYFAGLLTDPSTHNEKYEFQHQKGRGILHLGKHRHGANNITSGTRYNLIVWFKGSPQCTCCQSCGH